MVTVNIFGVTMALFLSIAIADDASLYRVKHESKWTPPSRFGPYGMFTSMSAPVPLSVQSICKILAPSRHVMVEERSTKKACEEKCQDPMYKYAHATCYFYPLKRGPIIAITIEEEACSETKTSGAKCERNSSK